MALETFVSPDGEPSRRPGKRSGVIYDKLRKEIMLGIQLPGQPLLELDLANRFHCSQSPVREALLKLKEEGLVVRVANRGTVVSDCSRDDMVELLRLRHSIECRGVVRAMKSYNKLVHGTLVTLLQEMEQAASDDNEYGLSVLDQQFHLRLYAEANLPSIMPMLERCLVHNHRYKILKTNRSVPLVETAQRHNLILEALLSGDLDKTVNAMSLHIETIVDFGPSILSANSVQEPD
ncbi:GntR family transcriptional regulator [Granulosicoccus sp.]|nr:GntR family transcriptional regulator [Granulosicoccus sp.]